MTAPPANHTAAGADREAQLSTLVNRWTAHMRWRTDYDRWREDRLWQEDTQSKRLRIIERHAGPLASRRVLDIGSGMGGFLVAARRNGIAAIGIEPHADYGTITRLRASRYDLAPFLARAVGEHLPFRNGAFTVVLAQDILEHVQDPDATLREIARVLAPGGVALVTAINRFAWRDPHYHIRGLNWLPRPVAERVIARVGRTKRGAGFADNQRLSDMYYDTWAGFVQRCAAAELVATDVRSVSVADPTIRPGGLRGAVVQFARQGKIAVPLYTAYRAAALGTFEAVLRHADDNRNDAQTKDTPA